MKRGDTLLFDVLKGKRILIMGGISPMQDLITLAHRNQMFVGVADYNKGTYLKQLADVSYDIDILDTNKVIDLYKQEHYDGIISNFNDMLLPYIFEVADQVGAYVPYNKSQIKMSTDKRYFKQQCMKYGIMVPKEYSINKLLDQPFNDVIFPVIVKPIDSSGSKGISICRNMDELREGYLNARNKSRTKQAIVEEYIDSDDEVNLTYIIQDGDIQLAAVHDRYFNKQQRDVIRVPDMYIYPSRYINLILMKYNTKIIQLIKNLDIRNGSLFLQGCVKEDCIYFYEAGMRLNGCKTYQILEYENNYNTFEHLLYFALTGKMGGNYNFDPRFKRWYATWNVVARPGARIHRIEGIEELDSYPWLLHNNITYYLGETIPNQAKGTLIQLQSRIHISGNTKEELLDHIRQTYKLYHVLDNNLNEVILTPHDVKDIEKRLNYEIK